MLSSVLLLGILECLFRFRHPVGRAELGLLFGVHPESRYVTDDSLSYRPKDPFYFWDDPGNPPTPKKKSETIRFFFLGDSFTKAHGSIGKEHAFFRQVEKALKRINGNNLEFFHFGVSGYCERQYLELLKRYGPIYHPDYALIQVYLGNDIGENAGLIVRALRLIRAGKMEGQRGIVDVHECSLDGPGDDVSPGQWMEKIHPARWSYLYRDVSRRLAVLFNEKEPLPVGALAKRGPDRQRSAALAQVNTRPHFISLMKKNDSPEIERAWEETARLVGLIAEEARQQKMTLGFLLVPQELQVNKRAWREARSMLRLHGADYDVDLPSIRFKEILRKHGIFCIDLTERFRAAIDDGTDLYDGHFNREGHDAAAAAILRDLKALGWPESPRYEG